MYASLHMGGGGGGSGSSFDALGSSARSASSLARAIRAEEYSLRNRIKSILDDRAFVATVRQEFPSMPLFANLRCGVWYVQSCSNGGGDSAASAPPSSSPSATHAESCYFKSTDGHAHHWKFSAARLNVHVLQRIIQHGQSGASNADGDADGAPSARSLGAVLIDSTRKGKRFPDSFSRTLPIWCTVWNRAIAEVRRRNNRAHPAAVGSDAAAAADSSAAASSADDPAWDTALHMPLWVSDMESRQIEERLPGFVATLLTSGVDVESIARGLLKPLRCLWIDRSSNRWADGERDLQDLPFTPLLLVQCSRVESETRGIGQRQGWSYIQGAGDDEENWQSVAGITGFTPAHLTRLERELVQLDHDDEIVERIRDALHDEAVQRAHAQKDTQQDAGALQLHRVPCGAHSLFASTVLPSHAAASTAAAAAAAVAATAPDSTGPCDPSSVTSSSPSPLSLLYLYFDNTLHVKQQRKTKLALEQQRAHQRAAEEEDELDEEEEEETAQRLASLSVQSPPSVDLLDWPADASLALPISSASKSRTSLLDVLGPSVDFIQSQTERQRSVVIVCEDVSYVSCICAAAVVAAAAAGTATAASTVAPTPTASSSSAPPVPAAAAPAYVDKNLIRSTLTAVKSHLLPHYPSRLLLKQLNHFFLNYKRT